MYRDGSASAEPFLPDLLSALDEPVCRTIIEHLEEPMTAQELATVCDVPVSTMYRKLDVLEDTVLLTKRLRLRRDGQHETLYELAFEEVSITLDETHSLTGRIE